VEGELVHTRRNSSRVVVASRWSLQRDPDAGRSTPRDEHDIRAQEAQDALHGRRRTARVTRVTTLVSWQASIAHEVNQPLTAIVADSNAALIGWLLQKPDLEIVRSTLIAIVKDSERAAKVFTRIRGMLSRSAQPYQPCDLRTIIHETLPMVRTEFARHTIRVRPRSLQSCPLYWAMPYSCSK